MGMINIYLFTHILSLFWRKATSVEHKVRTMFITLVTVCEIIVQQWNAPMWIIIDSPTKKLWKYYEDNTLHLKK